MLVKDFFVIVGIALTGASVVVLAIHFGLKMLKPAAFSTTQSPRMRERERGMRSQFQAQTQPRVEQISLTLSDAMGSYWAAKVQSRTETANRRAQVTLGGILAPTGQAQPHNFMVAPHAVEQGISGAANAALSGASS